VACADGGVAGALHEVGVWSVYLFEGLVLIEDYHVGADSEDGALGCGQLVIW